MKRASMGIANAAALCVGLSGCAGGAVTGVSDIAPPRPASAPAPPPPVAVAQSTDFQSLGSSIQIRWDNVAKNYAISLPSGWQKLVPADNRYSIQDASGGELGTASFGGSNKYGYTGFAYVHTADGVNSMFAYGIPAAASAVPVSGTATYTADLSGAAGTYSVAGTATLNFDFADGTLGGSLTAAANDPGGWGPYDLGQYDFVQTVYSRGSTTFSGALSHSGLPDGSFNGLFTGPAAQELMGQWQFPFKGIWEEGQTLNASGVFVGRKGP